MDSPIHPPFLPTLAVKQQPEPCRVRPLARLRAAGLSLLPALVAALSLSGCTKPVSLREQDVLKHVAHRYRAFFPDAADPDPRHDVGLLRPRFGLPAILGTGSATAATAGLLSFDVEVMERGGPVPLALALVPHELPTETAARCASLPTDPPATATGWAVDPAPSAEPGCHPLRIVSTRREPLPDGAAHVFLTVQALGPVPPRDYDLYLRSPVDSPTRAPRSVWLRPGDPAAAPLRIAHLSDLHVGKGRHGRVLENLERVLNDVNAGAPDLVVLTGDIANMGTRARLEERAAELLQRLNAPVLAVLGNHDHGFGSMLFRTPYGAGWANFARVFHPSLLYSLNLGGWEFIGFDSGPSEFSARVLTRGLSPESLAVLEEKVAAAQRAGRRGVILFSHAPSRAALSTRADPEKPGPVGRMYRGARAFETVLLRHAPELRLIHLSGHTHWSDLYEAHARAGEAPRRFVRWDANSLTPCLTPLRGRVSLITTQSATHTTFPLRKNGQGYGFTWLVLDERAPQVAFQRYRGPAAQKCEQPAVGRSVALHTL